MVFHPAMIRGRLIENIRELKSKTTGRHFNELIWIAIGQVFSLGLGFVSIRLLSSLGPSDFGKYSLILTLSGLLNSIWYGPIEQGAVRSYYSYSNTGFSRLFIGLFYKVLVFSGVVVGLIGIALCLLAFQNDWSILLVLASTFYVLAASTSTSLFALLNLLRRRSLNSTLQLVEKALGVIFIFAAFSMSKPLLWPAVGLLAVSAIISIGTRVWVFEKVLPEDTRLPIGQHSAKEKEIVAVVKRFSTPFIIWGLAGWLQLNSDKWIIERYLSLHDVGVYSLMMMLANILIVVPYGIISQFITPIVYERFSDLHNRSKVAEGFRFLSVFVILISCVAACSIVFMWLYGEQLIVLVSGRQYLEASYLAPWLVLGVGLFYVGQAMCSIGLSLNVPEKYLVPKIVAAVLAVSCNALFAQLYGLNGIALAFCVVGLAYLLGIKFINKGIVLPVAVA